MPKKVVVIGGGPGGYVAAIRSAQLGSKVILVEEDKIGGTCLNKGCIPTKALLSDAKLFHSLKHSPIFQFNSMKGYDPLESMMMRKEKVVQELVKGIGMLLESYRVNIKYGKADLIDNRKVVLLKDKEEPEMIEGDSIILAPGSRSRAHQTIAPDGEKILTSDEILKIKEIPDKLVIVGGGYIGIEFATLFSLLGSKVTIVEILDDILTGMEEELLRNLKRFLKRDGIEILTKADIEDIHFRDEEIILAVKTPQGTYELITQKLLVAIGRAPNLDLNFSKAGVETSSKGIRVNSRMETTAPQIYAVGDAIGGPLLAHVAMEEGIVAAENVMGMNRQFEDRLIPICVFTYPEIASVGLTEKEGKRLGEIKVGRFPFRSNPKALISGETDGLIKVVANRKTSEILGIHIIGSEASTLISVACSIINQKCSVKDLSHLIYAHPTITEALKEAVLDVDGLAIHLPKPLRVH